MDVNLGVLSSPSFWLIQFVLMFVAWVFKRIFDLLLWRTTKKVRTTVERMGDENFRAQCERELSEAPGNFLRLVVARSLLKRVHRRQRTLRTQESENKPLASEGTVQVAAATSKTKPKKIKKQRPPRVRLNTRLTRAFNTLGAAVIGGEEGEEYMEQWRTEQREINNPLVMAGHALTNAISAVRIRVILKTAPRLRRVFTRPARLINAMLDTIAFSDILAGILVGGSIVTTIMGLSLLIIGSVGVYIMAIPSGLTAHWVVIRWQQRRRIRREE